MLVKERRHRIVAKLEQEGRIEIAELSREMGVSRMTIHRDLQQLEAAGVLRRTRGGAVPVNPKEERGESVCAMCGMRVRLRTVFVLHYDDGALVRACCPHCGLMLLGRERNVTSALAADFLYGRMINVRSAVFLVASTCILCCTPSVLCFQTRDEARRFQKGFGGRVMAWEDAQKYVQESMALSHP